jgi:cytochrome P450
MLAFGTGTRSCLGESFIKSRIFLFVAVLLQQFTLKPADPQDIPSCDPRRYVTGLLKAPVPYMLRAEL